MLAAMTIKTFSGFQKNYNYEYIEKIYNKIIINMLQ